MPFEELLPCEVSKHKLHGKRCWVLWDDTHKLHWSHNICARRKPMFGGVWIIPATMEMPKSPPFTCCSPPQQPGHGDSWKSVGQPSSRSFAAAWNAPDCKATWRDFGHFQLQVDDAKFAPVLKQETMVIVVSWEWSGYDHLWSVTHLIIYLKAFPSKHLQNRGNTQNIARLLLFEYIFLRENLPKRCITHELPIRLK